ncbi:uncharacterized protein LOC144366091 [Ictidomys tridecemlineatus]
MGTATWVRDSEGGGRAPISWMGSEGLREGHVNVRGRFGGYAGLAGAAILALASPTAISHSVKKAGGAAETIFHKAKPLMLMKIFYLEDNSKKVTRSHPVVKVTHQQGENMDENQLPGCVCPLSLDSTEKRPHHLN